MLESAAICFYAFVILKPNGYNELIRLIYSAEEFSFLLSQVSQQLKRKEETFRDRQIASDFPSFERMVGRLVLEI